MFPAATAPTFARNVVRRGILALFQFWLGRATFSNGLSRYAGRGTGRMWLIPGGSKARYDYHESESGCSRFTL